MKLIFDQLYDDDTVAITPTWQRNAVSEGIALGILLNGRTSVPFDKVAVDLAFTGAWRGWGYADRFPQVSTDLNNGSDGIWVMTRATNGKNVWVLYWERSGHGLNIFAGQSDWDPTDEADIAHALRMIDGGVPREGWESLAQSFLDRMDR